MVTQPVPYVAPGPKSIGFVLPANYLTTEVPLVTDPSVAHVALVAGVRQSPGTDGGSLSGRSAAHRGRRELHRDSHPASGGFSSLTISPTANGNGKKSYYVGRWDAEHLQLVRRGGDLEPDAFRATWAA